MKKMLCYLSLMLLFSCPAMAGAPEYPEYVEGEVLVVLDAPAESDHIVMGSFNANLYSWSVSNQADNFARVRRVERYN